MIKTIISLSFPLVAVALAAIIAKRVMTRTQNAHKSFGFNLSTVGTMLLMFVIFSFTASADSGTAAQAAQAASNSGLGLIAAGLCTGLAGIGGGIALASGVPAAIGAVSEDPKAFGKSLIFVALGETIALYGVVISVMILSKI